MSFMAIIVRADSAKPQLQPLPHHFKIVQTADSLAGCKEYPALEVEL